MDAPDLLERRITALPKAELHLHLDGSVGIETAVELARTRGIDAPRSVAGMRARLVAPPRCADQAELLRAFDLPIALLQDAEALARVTEELVIAKAADNVRYLEIRWGPLLHLERGLSLADGIAAVCDGADRGMAAVAVLQRSRERGMVAVAALQRPPGGSIVVRLICTALRSHDPDDNVRLAETAVRFRDRGLVGWDLAGREAEFPDPLLHARAFGAARAGGLRITLHAGEWGGAAQVRRALALDPERIAHGPGAIDDPTLMSELIAREVTLDLCPTSNVQAAIVPSLAEHPLAELHRAGVPVSLSTDDLTVSNVTLSDEYARAISEIGLSFAELWAIDRHALDVAFADEATLAPLRSSFDAWAGGLPG